MYVSLQMKNFAITIASAAITLWKKILHTPTTEVSHAVIFVGGRCVQMVIVLHGSLIFMENSTAHIY